MPKDTSQPKMVPSTAANPSSGPQGDKPDVRLENPWDFGWHEEKCPHLHFKFDVVNRSILTKKQYLNLLSTPKGYRWEVVKKPHVPKDEEQKEESIFALDGPKFSYVHNFLKDVWNVLSEDMVKRLIQMLVSEFGMTEEEAITFICEQRLRSMKFADPVRPHRDDHQFRTTDEEEQHDNNLGEQSAHRAQKRRNQPDPHQPRVIINPKPCEKEEFAIGVDPCHVREFANVVANKLSQYATDMMCARRDQRHRRMAEVILHELCQMTGEKCALDKPKNRLHQIMTFTADKVAWWLNANIPDRDKIQKRLSKKQEKRRQKLLQDKYDEDKRRKQKGSYNKDRSGEKKKAKDKDDKERKNKDKKDKDKPKSKERPKSPRDKPKSSDTQKRGKEPTSGDGKRKPQDKQQKPSSEPKSKGKSDGARGDVGAKGKPAPKSQKPSAPPGAKRKEEEPKKSNKSGASASSGRDKDQPGDSQPRPGQESRPSPPPSENKDSSKSGEPGATTESSETAQPPATDSEQKDATAAQGADEPPTNTAPKEEDAGGEVPATSRSTTEDEKKEEKGIEGEKSAASTSAESSQKESSKMSDSKLDQTVKEPEKGRQDALEGVIADKLEKRVPGEDKETKSAVGDVSKETAAWMDKKIKSVEDELTPTSKEKKGREPMFSVKKLDDWYDISQTYGDEAAKKIRQSRGREVTKEIRRTESAKVWAQWGVDASDISKVWAQWIDKTVQEAQSKAMDYKSKGKEMGNLISVNTEDWDRFKDQTQKEALEWRRNKKAMEMVAQSWPRV